MWPRLAGVAFAACVGEIDDGAPSAGDGTALARFRPAWVATGENAGALFGSQVVSADVNGDGYDDLLVAASGSDRPNKQTVYAFHGSSTGLSADPDWADPLDNRTIARVITAADVNGDGFDDLLVGDPGWDNDRGALFQFLGSAAGLETAATRVSEGDSLWFARQVSAAGDVNGDGFDDLLVGESYFYTDEVLYIGAAYLFVGSSTGLQHAPVWAIRGREEYDSVGTLVVGPGDVNADGFDDVGVVTSTQNLVFEGSSSGPITKPGWAEPNLVLEGVVQTFGRIGDADADGFDDVWQRSVEGKAPTLEIMVGSTDGLSHEPATTYEKHVHDDTTAGPAGDVNHDGQPDIFLASAGIGQATNGRVALLLGPLLDPQAPPAYVELVGPQPFGLFGVSVAFADTDADGVTEIAVGASGLEVDGNDAAGGVFVYPLNL